MNKTCQVCNNPIPLLRSDALYCTPTCRSKAHQQRAKRESFVPFVQSVQPVQPVQSVQPVQPNPSSSDRTRGPLVQPLDGTPECSEVNVLYDLLKADLQDLKQKELNLTARIDVLIARDAEIPKLVRKLKGKVCDEEQLLADFTVRLQLGEADIYDNYVNKKLMEAIANRASFAHIHAVYRDHADKSLLGLDTHRSEVNKLRANWQTERDVRLLQLRALQDGITDLEMELTKVPRTINLVMDQLRDVRLAKSRLYGIRAPNAPAPVHRTTVPTVQPYQERNATKPSDLTAEDIRNSYYETFSMPTELGRFLGNLDRNKLAFALTGDSGAGKSHLAFALARLFSEENFRTKIFCLEEGIGHLTQEKVNKYNLSEDVVLSGTAALADIRRDAALYDLIVLDSFNKLNVDASEFERLRTDFPKTIFVIVFQKTTTGSIRGGSSIIFNSAAAIDVTKVDDDRVATMAKGRYGTQGWVYSIAHDLIIHEN